MAAVVEAVRPDRPQVHSGPHHTTKAWLGLGAYVVTTEVCAPEGELLSEAVDRWLEKQPAKAVSALAIIGTTLHLLNLLPEKYDPFAITMKSVRAARR